jgi:hypothetical protein
MPLRIPRPTTRIFAVSGRGEMQIAILVEQMRREGYGAGLRRKFSGRRVEWRTARGHQALPRSSPRISARSWKTSFRAQIANMNHVEEPCLHRGAHPDARLTDSRRT